MSDSAPVFLVPSLPDADTFVLDGPEGRHAAAVRRLGPGEDLVLADGRGAAAACVVDSVAGKDSVALRVGERWREPAPRPRVVLVQGLVKGDRGELAVELATETGVDEIVPWRAERCVARWDDGPRGAKALARWQSTVRESAKQSRRAWVPPVVAPIGLRGLIERVRSADCAVLLDAQAQAGIVDVSLPADGAVLVIVGPEGGVSPRESAALCEAGARAARLGPTVLRASTAGAIAIAALGVITRRWR